MALWRPCLFQASSSALTVSNRTATHDRTETEPSTSERPLRSPFVWGGGPELPGSSPKRC